MGFQIHNRIYEVIRKEITETNTSVLIMILKKITNNTSKICKIKLTAEVNILSITS